MSGSGNEFTAEEARRFRDEHARSLQESVLPFWLPRAVDRKHGGFYTGFDRAGNLIESDKSIWFQGRFSWLLSRLHTDLEPRPQWLSAAESGVRFLLEHAFDSDGRMFFRVAADGTPLIKRRYLFSEAFAIIALAAFSEASGEARYLDRARELLSLVDRYARTPGLLEPKWLPSGRVLHGLAFPMIMIATLQEIRRSDPANARLYSASIAEHISTIRDRFLDHEHRCLLETVGPDGPMPDHNEGRLINPGHALEAAWFILKEARHGSGNSAYRDLGLQIYNWMWEWGWDRQHGGILYFRDALDHPSSEYWHDMKFWWPQCEAMLASLEAVVAGSDQPAVARYRLVHDWTYRHFPDQTHGEWFGYLRRDGSVSSEVKGNMFKGPFHVPRMQLLAMGLLDQIVSERTLAG